MEDQKNSQPNAGHLAGCNGAACQGKQGSCMSKWGACGHKSWLCVLLAIAVLAIVFCAGVAAGSEFGGEFRGHDEQGFCGGENRPMMYNTDSAGYNEAGIVPGGQDTPDNSAPAQTVQKTVPTQSTTTQK
jgi:hypothetical protein